jgi:hypothetical protein
VTINRHVALTVLIGVQRTRVNVDVGVKLLARHTIAAREQQSGNAGRDNALAQRRHHATSDKNVSCFHFLFHLYKLTDKVTSFFPIITGETTQNQSNPLSRGRHKSKNAKIQEQQQMITEYAKYNQVFHNESNEPQLECEPEQQNEPNNNNETQTEEKENEVTESALKKLLNEELVPKKKEVMIKNDFVFEEEEFPTIDKVANDSNKNIMKKKGGKKKGNKNKFTEINIDIFDHSNKDINNNDSNSNENSSNNNNNKIVSSIDVFSKANSLTAKKQQQPHSNNMK